VVLWSCFVLFDNKGFLFLYSVCLPEVGIVWDILKVFQNRLIFVLLLYLTNYCDVGAMGLNIAGQNS